MYTEKDARELVIKAGHEMLRKGLIARTWGNISARISDEQFVITPSGRAYDSLKPEDLVIVNIADSKTVGEGKPSSEKALHAAIYGLRPEVNAIVHTHQDYATAMSTLGQPLSLRSRNLNEQSDLGTEVPLAKYALSSTKPLADAVSEEIASHPDSKAVLMRNHGVIIAGTDFAKAFGAAETLETLSRERFKVMAGTLWPKEADDGYDPESGVLREDITGQIESVYEDEKVSVIRSRAPFTKAYSNFGRKLVPYVDDLAMALNYDIPIRKSSSIRISRSSSSRAVLIKGKGALISASTREEAETIAILLEKTARIGLLREAGFSPEPVSRAHAMIEHRVYVQKYSKLK